MANPKKFLELRFLIGFLISGALFMSTAVFAASPKCPPRYGAKRTAVCDCKTDALVRECVQIARGTLPHTFGGCDAVLEDFVAEKKGKKSAKVRKRQVVCFKSDSELSDKPVKQGDAEASKKQKDSHSRHY